MAHWFHRNPIKPTEPAKFELKGVLTKDCCSRICSELRLRRDQIGKHFRDASGELTVVDKDVSDYLAMFYGFLYEVNENDEKKDSKLIPLIRTKWGHSMLVGAGTELSDAWFEALNIILNHAMWLMKHGAWLAGKDEVRDSEAKECLQCLRRAAGMFAFVNEQSGRLAGANDLDGSDFDKKVLLAYELQATAEAQEVVIARAIEMKHNNLLISSIASNTANMFAKADQQLSTFAEDIYGRWRRYLQLKNHLYTAVGYAFLGESLLSEDKCGDAVRCCREGVSEFKIASDFAQKYAVAPGPGSRIKPETHQFFRNIEPMLNRHLEKALRENGFIYHQACPKLDSEANYGLSKAAPYEYPAVAQCWTPAVYSSFDLSKADMPDFSKIKKSKTKLEPVTEEKIYQSEKDPNNSSGCVLM